MATLHLMVGLPCSGKTTLAKKLEHERSALRLTPDEWQVGLFGQDAKEPEHDARHSFIETSSGISRAERWNWERMSSSILAFGHEKNAKITGCGRNTLEPAVKSIFLMCRKSSY